MRGRILCRVRGRREGICMVAESCHQTSEGIGLMASFSRERNKKIYLYSKQGTVDAATVRSKIHI